MFSRSERTDPSANATLAVVLPLCRQRGEPNEKYQIGPQPVSWFASAISAFTGSSDSYAYHAIGPAGSFSGFVDCENRSEPGPRYRSSGAFGFSRPDSGAPTLLPQKSTQ